MYITLLHSASINSDEFSLRHCLTNKFKVFNVCDGRHSKNSASQRYLLIE